MVQYNILHMADCMETNFRTYVITVETGALDSAGTDAAVYLTMMGESGASTGEMLLDNPKNNFEIGGRNTFYLPMKDIGPVGRIRIRHDNSGEKPGWFLDQVTVSTKGHGTWVFACHRWLARDEGDGRIDIEVDRSSVIPEPLPEQIARYGATVKVGHVLTGRTLHLHAHNYGHPGSSSGQQQVTCYEWRDNNDLWRVKASDGQPHGHREGEPVKNGEIVRTRAHVDQMESAQPSGHSFTVHRAAGGYVPRVRMVSVTTTTTGGWKLTAGANGRPARE